jgi:xanthine dehydrogenase accessory factor
MSWLADIADEIDRHGSIVRVTVIRADGSTPREVGAAMIVSAGGVRDTVGGGALELAAIDHARRLLAAASARDSLSPPPSGQPQARPRHEDPEGDGERDGVRGSRGLQPFHSGSAHRPESAPSQEPLAERVSLVAAPHPNPLPASGERGSGRRLDLGTQPLSWLRATRDFPLGPSLGQCCGGYTRLLFEVLGRNERPHLANLARNSDAARGLLLRPVDGGTPPYVTADRKEHRAEWPLGVTRAVREALSGARPRAALLVRGAKGEPAWFIEALARPLHHLCVYGAGHVGRAIVRVLEDLPFAVTWVDTSASRFPARLPPYARAEIAPDPAAFAGAAAADAFHLVLTYSHTLDLAICHSLLRRGDFRFLGLIGSATKRARFLRRLAELGIGEPQLNRLVCPIGMPGISGKEPAMIAVSVAAQLVQLATAAEGSTSLSSSGREDVAT